MRKLLIISFAIFTALLAGCLKDKAPVDFSKVGTVVEMEYPAGASNSGLGSGMEYFAGQSLLYPPSDLVDTATFLVNIASPNPLGSALSVTIGIDPSAIANYNSDTTHPVNFTAMPDSDYTIISTTATIPAGSRLATFQVAFYPSKLDPTQNFMLPITITDASGKTISGDFATIYFHTIGNPIAGVYEMIWTRWNASDTTGAPTYDHYDLGQTLFAPVTPLEVAAQSLGTGDVDEISFINTGGVLSNFSVNLEPVAGITYLLSSPNAIMEVADPINGYYRIFFKYNNGSADRCIINEYYKQ